MSNHSVRKTGIGCLLDANVPEIYVAQHSGMKSIDSLSSYKHANEESQVKMSDILNRNKKNEASRSLRVASSSNNEFENIELDDWNIDDWNLDVIENAPISNNLQRTNFPTGLHGLFSGCQINNLNIHIHKS